ncbi:sugar ABC transporter permease [Anaerolineaceae bacterium oral taxon 439]|nr:sugar ABC transporter permease [Anaerolineaceae bacterium oral taxon 439]
MKERKLFGMTKELFLRRYGITFIFIAMVILLSIVSPVFRTWRNWVSILQQVSTNGILALGMVFVITAGGIDLSIGSMLALTSVVVGETLIATNSIPLAIFAAIVICSIFGFINGILVARFDLFPFVVTLATQLVIRGMAYIVSGGQSKVIMHPNYRDIGLGKIGGIIPFSVLILLGVATASYILLHQTTFGRYIYAVGGNKDAARASGVNVEKTIIQSYILMGGCSAISGVILASRINASQPNIGMGYETDAIAACVIGGTSFAGGVSTIPGAMIGIFMIGIIYNGMNLLQVQSYWQTVIKGLLILLAVLLDMYLNKKRSK